MTLTSSSTASKRESNAASTRQAIHQPASSFTMFSHLPTEIQHMVWKLAVPEPRKIRGAILAIIDLDLGKPGAILPSIRELKRSHSLAIPNDVDDDGDMFEEFEMWDMDDPTMADDRRPILSLLHACHASRMQALATYRLDIVSIVPGENTPLWSPEDDMVCFLLGPTWQETRTHMYWLLQQQENQHPSLSSLQHLAFRLDRIIAVGLGINSDRNPPRFQLENRWFHNFPALQSLSIFIDPVNAIGWSGAHYGKIVLYEPEDVPISLLRGRIASVVERDLTEQFERLVPKGMEVPLVELFVTSVRKPKNSKRVGS